MASCPTRRPRGFFRDTNPPDGFQEGPPFRSNIDRLFVSSIWLATNANELVIHGLGSELRLFSFARTELSDVQSVEVLYCIRVQRLAQGVVSSRYLLISTHSRHGKRGFTVYSTQTWGSLRQSELD